MCQKRLLLHFGAYVIQNNKSYLHGALILQFLVSFPHTLYMVVSELYLFMYQTYKWFCSNIVFLSLDSHN